MLNRSDMRISNAGHVIMGGRRYGYVWARMDGATRRERKAAARQWILEHTVVAADPADAHARPDGQHREDRPAD